MPTDLDLPPPRPDPPEPVRTLLETLRAAGHEAVLVGGCLRDLCLARRVADWDVATSARPEATLALFPRAVPIGLRHGTVMVPGPAGPVDVTTYRAADLAGDLARRDFTINAMAWSPEPPHWIDPQGGLADLRSGRLRAVGAPGERLREDPLRALRAARLVAELDLALDPELREALAQIAPRLRAVSAERIKTELERLLAAPRAGRALALLRETGIEAALLGAPIAADAAAVVAALPPDVSLRLAAWLRGRDAAALLGRLRFPRQRAEQVAALLRHHPVEVGRGPAELGRLFLQLGREETERLLALRSAELAAGALPAAEAREAEARLAALRATLARLTAAEPQRLAVGGAQVMAWLGLRPGPEVGRALRFLSLQILEDPRRNEPATLRALLEAWRRAQRRAD